MLTVEYVRNEFKRLLQQENFIIDKSGVKTVEIINAAFIANQNLIFGTINQEYIEKELYWYKSQSLNVNDIKGTVPEIWRQIADENGNINSNYGWCIYSEDNGLQFNNIIKELKLNKHSRRATMIYNRPTMHVDYNKNGMSDFICTNTVQYLIRDNKVNALVYMRSNDAVFGYKNDYAWQQWVLSNVVDELNNDGHKYDLGTIYWNVASLHVYERHFKFIL